MSKVKVVPGFVSAITIGTELFVWKSVLVHDDGPMMQPVREEIDQHVWTLVAEEHHDDPEMMQGRVKMRVYA